MSGGGGERGDLAKRMKQVDEGGERFRNREGTHKITAQNDNANVLNKYVVKFVRKFDIIEGVVESSINQAEKCVR